MPARRALLAIPTAAALASALLIGDPAPAAGSSPAEVDQAKFIVFNRPVSAYTENSCVADLTGYEDDAIVGQVRICERAVNFATGVRKRTVPDGGWATWGAPPHRGRHPGSSVHDRGEHRDAQLRPQATRRRRRG